MMDTYHDAFSKHIEYTPPRVNPHIKCGLGVIMMCQYRFISYNKYPICREGWYYKGGYECREQRAYGKSLYLPLNFAVNL